MARGNWRKRWIKLFVAGWLHGTIRWQLSSEERGVWADFLALAGEKQKEGAICDNDGRALPLDFIANQLNIKRTLLDKFIAKAIDEDMIALDDNGVIHVIHYQEYQSEYERQKPYREAKADKELSEVEEELARQEAHQDKVSKMSSKERQADAERLSAEWDEAHAGDPNFDKDGEPVFDKQEMREDVAEWNKEV